MIISISPKLGKSLLDPIIKDARVNALILVNGKEISVLKGLDTLVEKESEVVLIPVTRGV